MLHNRRKAEIEILSTDSLQMPNLMTSPDERHGGLCLAAPSAIPNLDVSDEAGVTQMETVSNEPTPVPIVTRLQSPLLRYLIEKIAAAVYSAKIRMI